METSKFLSHFITELGIENTSNNVVTVADGIGPFECSPTVVLEEGGYGEVYVKARKFVK